MKEIGSEFEWCNNGIKNSGGLSVFSNLGKDIAMTFSGRTAFETVILDIKKIKKVAFPSYCCKSMIEPFIKYGIEIEFYQVDWNGHFISNINENMDCDAIVICNYFGFHVDYPIEILNVLRQRGCIIIEDVTHSMLSLKQKNYDSDYFVASLRKWGALTCGGICAKENGPLNYRPFTKPEKEFTLQKINAMKLKENYLFELGHSSINTKEEYLNMFKQCNEWLENNYSDLTIDDISRTLIQNWNVSQMRKKRIENAKILYEGLKNIHGISFLFPKEKMDCPLFVPIVIDESERNEIRKSLKNNNIYCPIHWPVPDKNSNSTLYDKEMSLICDQRYTSYDMYRIIDVIKKG